MLDWTKLPDLLSVGLLAWAFASVARRSPAPVSHHWLNGWVFILVHFAASMFLPAPGVWGNIALFWSIEALIISAILFMRASAPKKSNRRIVLTAVSAAIGSFGLLIYALVFSAPHWFLNLSEALVGTVPILLSIFARRWTSLSLRWIMSLLHLTMWFALWKVQSNPDAVGLSFDIVLFTVYLGCAIHFWYRYRTKTTGSLIGLSGFILWACVFAIGPMLGTYFPTVNVESEVWNLPKYVVAVAMILLMLETQIAHNKHLALHDELTGLPNRRLFTDRLTGALERARRAGANAALLIVDLDDFKFVNDTYGHHVGDLLLQKVAKLFSGRIRNSDTVARTGGDEFAIVLEPPVTREDATLVGHALLDLLNQPLQLAENKIEINASVGIAVFPDDAEDMKSLYILADMQMYKTKRDNRSVHSLQHEIPVPTPSLQPQPAVSSSAV